MSEEFKGQVRQLYNACTVYLRDTGIFPEAQLLKAARAVVWARYTGGDDGWDRLKEAIGALEEMVGRPQSEADI